MKGHTGLAEPPQVARTLRHSPGKALRGLIFTKSTTGFPSCVALSPHLLVNRFFSLLGAGAARGQKCASGHISLEALLSCLRPQLTLLLAIWAHFEVLLSPELFLLYVWLRVCVCVCLCVSVCLFFFNLCFPSLKCWDLGGVSFRKPSLANVHDHSLLLMLTHCLHFLLLGICLLCARLGPGEELVGKTCRWGTCIQMVKQLFDTAGPLHVGHLRCQKHRGVLFKKLKTAILSDWASVSLTGFG